VRTRGLLRALSEEVFGASVPLYSFPCVKSLRGLGMSDSESYAAVLREKFDYTNTHFHRAPKFDISGQGAGESGSYDFLIASEVFEHVVPPVEAAFRNAWRLLKPNGVMIFTAPYSLKATTAEHFPNLHEHTVAQLGEQMVLVNRTREGQVQVFENLIFHGGLGTTLEMREFSETGLRDLFIAAGFQSVRIFGEDYAPFGIVRNENCSLPLAARKGEFSFSRENAAEMIENWQRLLRRKWVRLGNKLGVV
jgi:SAM-dependent methyltransferase